jgi:transcriptional regulator with XRE-family HTH domain
LKTLGDRLKNAREKKNLTQVYVSKRTGINNKTISNYENNVSSPDPETLKIFTEVYETSADYLIGRTESVWEKGSSTIDNSKFVDVSGLPEEAVKQVEDYIAFLKQKYKSL